MVSIARWTAVFVTITTENSTPLRRQAPMTELLP